MVDVVGEPHGNPTSRRPRECVADHRRGLGAEVEVVLGELEGVLGAIEERGDGNLETLQTIADKIVTYDFARQMEGATEIKCSEFGSNIISHM